MLSMERLSSGFEFSDKGLFVSFDVIDFGVKFDHGAFWGEHLGMKQVESHRLVNYSSHCVIYDNRIV